MSLSPIGGDRIGPGAALESQIQFARALAESSLLPKQYQKQPANVLLAIQLGEALGIPAIQAINSIHVVEGKPTSSADLIAAVVRRAGHKLRVTVDDKNLTATATLIRHDDPDFEFTVTWDRAKAERAGLAGKQNWRNHPVQMMRARAITEVVRMAASDSLYGVIYTPEELGHDDTARTYVSQVAEDQRSLREILQQKDSEDSGGTEDASTVSPSVSPVDPPHPDGEDGSGHADTSGEGGRRVGEGSTPKKSGRRRPATKKKPDAVAGGGCTVEQQGLIQMHFKRLKIDDRDERLEWTAKLAGRDRITSSKELTADEASTVIDQLSKFRDHDQLRASTVQDVLDAEIVEEEADHDAG